MRPRMRASASLCASSVRGKIISTHMDASGSGGTHTEAQREAYKRPKRDAPISVRNASIPHKRPILFRVVHVFWAQYYVYLPRGVIIPYLPSPKNARLPIYDLVDSSLISLKRAPTQTDSPPLAPMHSVHIHRTTHSFTLAHRHIQARETCS